MPEYQQEVKLTFDTEEVVESSGLVRDVRKLLLGSWWSEDEIAATTLCCSCWLEPKPTKLRKRASLRFSGGACARVSIWLKI